jgi:hypothetical protein
MRLEQLLDSHHYARGLALVPQGMPTNNISGRPAAYPTPDPDAAASFAVERGPPLAQAETSGEELAAALERSAFSLTHIRRI